MPVKSNNKKGLSAPGVSQTLAAWWLWDVPTQKCLTAELIRRVPAQYTSLQPHGGMKPLARGIPELVL